jgi:hypothetical protein
MRKYPIEGAAWLKGTSMLELFKFKDEPSIDAPRMLLQRHDRRSSHISMDALGSFFDIRSRDHDVTPS